MSIKNNKGIGFLPQSRRRKIKAEIARTERKRQGEFDLEAKLKGQEEVRKQKAKLNKARALAPFRWKYRPSALVVWLIEAFLKDHHRRILYKK